MQHHTPFWTQDANPKGWRDHLRSSTAHSRGAGRGRLRQSFMDKCSTQVLSSGRTSASTGISLSSTLKTHASELSVPLSPSGQHSSSISPMSSTAATVATRFLRSRQRVTVLSFASASRSRQSAHLWPSLPQLRHSSSNLAGLFKGQSCPSLSLWSGLNFCLG